LNVELQCIIGNTEAFVNLWLIFGHTFVGYARVLGFKSEAIPTPDELVVLDYLVMLLVDLGRNFVCIILGVRNDIAGHHLGILDVAFHREVKLRVGYAIVQTILVVVHRHLRLIRSY
jgi:hypothetical protein